MEVAKIQVGGTCACAYEKKTIRAGMVGVTVSFAFDEYWDGLDKIAVYRCGGVVRDECLEGDTGTIPAEVLTKSGFDLEVGVYGTDAEKQIAIPTCWANLGVVRPGADPSGDPAADPSLPIWAQILAKLGNLADLNTEAKENLVAAINEALTKGRGEVDPEEIGRIVDEHLEKNPPAAYTLPIATETTLGGVKAAAATEEMTQPVGITAEGKLVTVPGQNSGGNVDLTGYATEQYVQEYAQPKGDYLTAVPDGYAKTEDIPTKPEDIGALPNTYTPPNQTAEQVGADPKGTAATAVSQHNTDEDSHNDIRLELKALSDRLAAFFDSDDTTLDELSEIVAYITNNKTLIESVTTSKVSVADIINNLTTNVSNKPLSAAQGVVLKGLIDAVSNSLANYQPKGNYLTEETDPTVPAWAKQPKKPSYTAAEVGALPDSTAIPTVPTKVSAFTNDAGYLTQHQDISGKVDVNTAQTFTEKQKEQARKNIGAAAAFNPTAYGIPVLYLTGDTTDMSKDNEVALGWTYGENNGSCTLKWQGSSSLAYDKKNYTIKLDSAIDVGWGSQKKYCLKANYIDHTHARNLVSAKLWGQMVASRSGVHSTLKTCPNYGAVDGFPIAIMLNGEFHGLYTWNIPKDKWTFNLGSGTQEAVICADVDTPAVDLRVHSTVTEKVDHALEEVTDEDNAGWVATSLNNLIDLCVNSYGSDLDTTIAKYMDWNSAIDYLILTVLIDGRDMYKKNYILVTYDGTKWIWSAYDMDSTYGLQWDGHKTLPANDGISFVKFRVNRVMELIYRFKTNALKSRHKALRTGVLSEENINVMFENFTHGIPSALYDADICRWPSIPGSSVITVDQILRWLTRRLAVVDKWIDELPAQETPVAPSAREGNVVASSIDSTGAVYNGVGYKDGYTIDISSDGAESEVAKDGCCITGYIPVTTENIIHVTTDHWNISPTNSRIIFYDMDFNPMGYYTQHGFVGLFNGYTNATAIKAKTEQSVSYGSDGMTTLNIAYGTSCTNLGYIRIRGVGKGANLVVIRDGEVPDHATEPETPAYTNQVPLSIDADGSVFNGVGYQNGYRISTSAGTASAETLSTISGFIPAKNGDVIRVYGVDWYNPNGSKNAFAAYDANFGYIGAVYGNFKATATGIISAHEVLNEHDVKFTLKTTAQMPKTISYVRVNSLGLGVATDGANMIVTVNEEVT